MVMSCVHQQLRCLAAIAFGTSKLSSFALFTLVAVQVDLPVPCNRRCCGALVQQLMSNFSVALECVSPACHEGNQQHLLKPSALAV